MCKKSQKKDCKIMLSQCDVRCCIKPMQKIAENIFIFFVKIKRIVAVNIKTFS